MWISQKVGALEQPSAQIQVGEVLSNTGSLSIQAVGQYSAVPLAAPFGITYVPPKSSFVGRRGYGIVCGGNFRACQFI